MNDLEINDQIDLILFLFSVLSTPLEHLEEGVLYDRESIVFALSLVDRCVSEWYNNDIVETERKETNED